MPKRRRIGKKAPAASRYISGDFTLVSSDGQVFKVDSLTLFAASDVFADASEVASGPKLVHFTDPDIDSGAVIRAFLDEIYDPPPLGRRVALDVYLPLAHFLAKYACPTVALKLGRRMVDGLVTKRVRPFGVWLVFAAFRIWLICEKILLFTIMKLGDSDPTSGWHMPQSLAKYIPWPYLAALNSEEENRSSAVAVHHSSPAPGAVTGLHTPPPRKQSFKVGRGDKVDREVAEAVGKRARIAVIGRETLARKCERTLLWVAETSGVQEWDADPRDSLDMNSQDE